MNYNDLKKLERNDIIAFTASFNLLREGVSLHNAILGVTENNEEFINLKILANCEFEHDIKEFVTEDLNSHLQFLHNEQDLTNHFFPDGLSFRYLVEDEIEQLADKYSRVTKNSINEIIDDRDKLSINSPYFETYMMSELIDDPDQPFFNISIELQPICHDCNNFIDDHAYGITCPEHANDEWITCKVCGASTTDRRSMRYTNEYALCNDCCNCFDDGICKAWKESED